MYLNPSRTAAIEVASNKKCQNVKPPSEALSNYISNVLFNIRMYRSSQMRLL